MNSAHLIPPGSESDAGRQPIVFIHGAWHSAFCWEKFFIPHFRGCGYAAYALNLLGHGGRKDPPLSRWTSLSQMVEDAIAILKFNFKDRMPILCGHSLGGRIVQEIMKKEDVPGVVLIAPAPARGILRCSVRLFLAQPADFLHSLFWMGDFYGLVNTPEKAHRNLFSSQTARSWVEEFSEELEPESLRIFFRMQLPVLCCPPKRPPPVLVIGGKNDVVFSQAEMRRTAEFYGGTFKPLDGIAHDVMLEPNWNIAAKEIVCWLSEHALGPGPETADNP